MHALSLATVDAQAQVFARMRTEPLVPELTSREFRCADVTVSVGETPVSPAPTLQQHRRRVRLKLTEVPLQIVVGTRHRAVYTRRSTIYGCICCRNRGDDAVLLPFSGTAYDMLPEMCFFGCAVYDSCEIRLACQRGELAGCLLTCTDV